MARLVAGRAGAHRGELGRCLPRTFNEGLDDLYRGKDDGHDIGCSSNLKPYGDPNPNCDPAYQYSFL